MSLSYSLEEQAQRIGLNIFFLFARKLITYSYYFLVLPKDVGLVTHLENPFCTCLLFGSNWIICFIFFSVYQSRHHQYHWILCHSPKTMSRFPLNTSFPLKTLQLITRYLVMVNLVWFSRVPGQMVISKWVLFMT